MRKLILAIVAALALAGGAPAAEIAVGKSRLEVANDLRLECEEAAQWGLPPTYTSTTQCIAAKLRELDAAIAATAPPCVRSIYDNYAPGATQNLPLCH